MIIGWFMMIHDFIQVVRNKFPDVIILYYCLDPIYPGLETVLSSLSLSSLLLLLLLLLLVLVLLLLLLILSSS